MNILIVIKKTKSVIKALFPTKKTSGTYDFIAEYFIFKVWIVSNLDTLVQRTGKKKKSYLATF